MDRPSWGDTLRATFGSCFCLTCSRSNSGSGDANSDDEYTNNNVSGVRGVRRARPDELEGLLADSNSANSGGDDGWGRRRSRPRRPLLALAPRPAGGGCVPPPRTPRHIALWGFDLFGSGRARGKGRVALEGGDEALHGAAQPTGGDAAAATPKRRRGERRSTDDLLARAALEGAAPTQLKDVTSADIARRARAGSDAREGETDSERRARRKARKEMRRLAAALAESPHTPDSAEFEGFPGSGGGPPSPTTSHSRGIPAPFLQLSAAPPDLPHHQNQAQSQQQGTDALAHLRAAEDEEAVDLDGLAYARLAPRPMGGSQSQSRSSGRSSNSGSAGGAPYSPVGESGMPKPKKSKKSKRSTKSHSSATSSTLASPPPTSPGFPSHSFAPSPLGDAGVRDSAIDVDDTFGPFADAGGDDAFDGTPGGFGASDFYGDDAAEGGGMGVGEEREVRREALPSPGLSRRGSVGFGKGMGGF
ncbi:hypothetical protein MSAN_01684000 [Mycena sanguinolenta]|uniref:Uncharacterized protein n=1 Tax=Mycena sanguinolenta TaxID=230812 RepID=A0A8H7CVC2_9AGAR|nr:hypothetical protein MSAN_01684000 [Mycena sanguinolenta]